MAIPSPSTTQERMSTPDNALTEAQVVTQMEAAADANEAGVYFTTREMSRATNEEFIPVTVLSALKTAGYKLVIHPEGKEVYVYWGYPGDDGVIDILGPLEVTFL